MNRRNFFSTVAKAAAAFSILPAATTYARAWKPIQKVILNPAWVAAPYECSFVLKAYSANFLDELRDVPHYPLLTRRYELVKGVYQPISKYVYA